MPKKFMMASAIVAIAFSATACKSHTSHTANTAVDLAANILDIGAEALVKDDGGPKWDELDRRLDALFANNTKEADEAVVILMSFYLGEHEGEEVEENLLSRGPRMIPLVEHYLREAPSSLLNEYPKRVRLERATTIGFLGEDLEILRVQAGARHVASTSIETSPLRDQSGTCTVKLVHRPRFDFGDDLIQPGESYRGAPALRADIDESGDLKHVELLSKSGIQRLDAQVLKGLGEWKYASRPHCGVIQANIVVVIDWMLSN
jgi:hypothetical protein